jgi:hypothetical protein
VFAKEIPLKETHLASGGSYSLGARTIRIPFTKTPPAMNFMRSILSGSGGDSVAEALGSISIPPHRMGLASHQTTLKVNESWESTNPVHWSNRETQAFLTNSPWTQTLALRIPSDAIGPNGPPWPASEQKCLVRWESAALVRDALAWTESKEYNDTLAKLSRDYYVLAVVSLAKGPAGVGGGRPSDLWSPVEMEGREATWLSPPGSPRGDGERVVPVRALTGENSEGHLYLYLFSRHPALENGNRALDFHVTIPAGMGRVSFTVRFSLNDLAGALEQGLKLSALFVLGHRDLRKGVCREKQRVKAVTCYLRSSLDLLRGFHKTVSAFL